MKTVDIPGGKATLREEAEVKVRHKRIVEAAAVAAATALSKLPGDRESLEAVKLDELQLTAAEATVLFELQDATIVAALADWTLPDPIPTLDTIGDLDSELYERLAEQTRDLGTAAATDVDFSPPDPSSPGFQASPTPPSDASVTVLRADQAPVSDETLPTSGPSTSTAASFTA